MHTQKLQVHWPSQQWWPSLRALGGTYLPLPRPTISVHPLHDRVVEPFLPQHATCVSVVAAWDKAIYRSVLGGEVNHRFPLMRKATELLTHARRASTKESYVSKWTRFHDFCQRTLPQVYNHTPERALTAKRKTVIKYLAHLQLEGRVHVNSLQPYIRDQSNTRRPRLRSPRPRPGEDSSRLRCFGGRRAARRRS